MGILIGHEKESILAHDQYNGQYINNQVYGDSN